MSEPITFMQYEHHGHKVWTRSDLKGTHRDHCLCYECGNFAPDTDHNCVIAQSLLGFDQRWHVVTPVYECPEFQTTSTYQDRRIKQLEILRFNLIKWLATQYRIYPLWIARSCDDQIDPSGALLGYVRDAAQQAEKDGNNQ